ncbi:MAG TPA: hypothetical protein VJ768_10035 [Anaerolineales bacterium]|nr:hypothetical protein [Anaerolineales bacterium]
MLTSLQAATIEQFGVGKNNRAQAHWIAGNLFDQAYSRAKRQGLWAKLTGKGNKLPVLPHQASTGHRSRGNTVIPLSKIIGTEGRGEDFDLDFNPLNPSDRDRWIGVAAARQLGIVLPAVELFQTEDGFYVRDGHHRISVAKIMGQLEIDARVVN